MKLQLFQVDAFASRVFEGNPAAVVPLEGAWLDKATMQAIALENHLSETAFFRPSSSNDADFDLRWFTPTREVDLCGHATLASAHVLVRHLGFDSPSVRFSSASGALGVSVEGERLVLDFPADPPQPCAQTDELAEALGARPDAVLSGRDLLAAFPDEAAVRAIQPDFAKLRRLPARGIIVTAPSSSDDDFVSRFFAPAAGVDEDPVTGSAHCILAPYWAKRLGKHELDARQVSKRGGRLSLVVEGDRVHIGGEAQTYLTGELRLP